VPFSVLRGCSEAGDCDDKLADSPRKSLTAGTPGGSVTSSQDIDLLRALSVAKE
jgi:hypothetical protein